MRIIEENLKALLDVEKEHPGIVDAPLLEYSKEWLSYDYEEKAATVETLKSKLVDGQDVDLTGTEWEADWLADGKVCNCPACTIVRKCITDIDG